MIRSRASGRRRGTRPRAETSAYQRRWLWAYWGAALLNAAFLLVALTGSGVPGSAYFTVATGAAASVLGALMATHLTRRQVDDRDFDEATGVMRAVVAAWVLLVASMVAATVIGTDFGARSSAGPEATQAVLDIADGIGAQLFGAAALLIVVGDGYSTYRRLLTTTRDATPRAARS